MSKTQHTPGPWKVVLHGHAAYVSIYSPLGLPRETGWAEFSIQPYSDPVRAAANARLIALAPEMLKLLREVLEWNEDDADLATNDTAFRLKNFADTVSNRSAALRAAIAKVEG